MDSKGAKGMDIIEEFIYVYINGSDEIRNRIKEIVNTPEDARSSQEEDS